ncbi:hypothetical protein RKE29_09175 [Streptomyces sp. B1866]|uniref:hypothetical protein n=1 Tax=Streptomyces sp. B1866 TaxID=3075431 RepID=UPI00288D9EC3|nr:hypothetical protein [Streptomyces sp. B1866]MDT3396811.1 hypothetical protein [Streptomyces sp. B1866]
MTGGTGLRLLPWATVAGLPCYAAEASGGGGSGAGPVGVLAGVLAEHDLLAARRLLAAVRDWTPSVTGADGGRLRAASIRLASTLTRVLRIAEERGERSKAAEAARLEMARVLLGHARDLLITGHAEPSQLRYLVARLAECLEAVTDVAEHRGAPPVPPGGGPDGGGPRRAKGGCA